MKINEGFVLRKMGDQAVIVSVGAGTKIFNGMIKLNESGEYLWTKILEGSDEEALVKDLVEKYDVTEEVAKEDVNKFVDILRRPGILQ